MFVVTVLFSIALGYYLISFYTNRRRYPPGPTPLPLFGNIIELIYLVFCTGTVVKALAHIKKKYGPVFTIFLGPMPTVHVSTKDAALEVFLKQGSKTALRWVPDMMNIGKDDKGIFASNGPNWVEQRRFALHFLRNFGGRNLMEQKILDEFEHRFSELNGEGSVVVETTIFDLLIGSVLNKMMFSERLDPLQEKEFFALKKSSEERVLSISIFDMIAKAWWMKVPIVRNRYQRIFGPAMKVRNFIRGQLVRRLEQVKSGEHVLSEEGDDYVDAFIIKMRQDKQNGLDTSFDEENLVVNLCDLWVAGQETTVSTLTWGCALLLNNPKAEKDVRDEVRSITRGSRRLTLDDKKHTPLLNATIMEIHRLASILNLNLWRKSTDDTYVNGCTIPKDTVMTAQIPLILSDENAFEDPAKFNPRRYIDHPETADNIIPFGVGKRICIGESMARAELYLILGNLLGSYSLSPADAVPPLTEKEPKSIVHSINSYKMKLTKL